MCDWQIKKDRLYQPTITVVNRHGDEVAFFKRESDAKRCVEAVNSEEMLREELEKLARLGNEPEYGNSEGNMIARNALAELEAK